MCEVLFALTFKQVPPSLFRTPEHNKVNTCQNFEILASIFLGYLVCLILIPLPQFALQLDQLDHCGGAVSEGNTIIYETDHVGHKF